MTSAQGQGIWQRTSISSHSTQKHPSCVLLITSRMYQPCHVNTCHRVLGCPCLNACCSQGRDFHDSQCTTSRWQPTLSVSARRSLLLSMPLQRDIRHLPTAAPVDMTTAGGEASTDPGTDQHRQDRERGGTLSRQRRHKASDGRSSEQDVLTYDHEKHRHFQALWKDSTHSSDTGPRRDVERLKIKKKTLSTEPSVIQLKAHNHQRSRSSSDTKAANHTQHRSQVSRCSVDCLAYTDSPD